MSIVFSDNLRAAICPYNDDFNNVISNSIGVLSSFTVIGSDESSRKATSFTCKHIERLRHTSLDSSFELLDIPFRAVYKKRENEYLQNKHNIAIPPMKPPGLG